MGPLFSLALIAMVSAAVFVVVFFAFRILAPTNDALRCACGFVVGAATGALLTVGLIALIIGAGGSLVTKAGVLTYLATVGIGAVAGGASLSYLVERKFR